MNMNIRKYSDNDWQTLCCVHDAARLHELRSTIGSQAFEPLADIAEEEGLFSYDIWVADNSSQVVGFVATYDNRIDWLYVHPDFHRRGFGRALLRHALSTLGPNAKVTVLADNDAALHLYQSEGLEPVEYRDASMRSFPARFIDLALKR